MIRRTGVFNLSMLSTDAPFGLFQHYGFQSGRDVDKFADVKGMARSDERRVLPAVLHQRVRVRQGHRRTIDFGTHTLFIADVTEAQRALRCAVHDLQLTTLQTSSPSPPRSRSRHGWVCKICGYVYEGETLPADFICPLCKHGAEDFEKLPD